MDPERWEDVKKIVAAALEREPEAWPSFLAKACGNDDGLRSEVERLLSAHRNAGEFMKSAVAPQRGDTTTSETPTSAFAVGQVVSDRYEIRRFIERGGMGEVYEAKDLELRTRVALKTIRPEISANLRTLALFRDEIKLARRISHRNVCRVYHLERCHASVGNGNPDIIFITMELLEGETLARRLGRQGRMSTAEALPLVRQMAEGLAAAHESGVVHCDFKPGNVMLVSETSAEVDSERSTQSVGEAGTDHGKPVAGATLRAVITDFGLARAMRPTVTRESIQESLNTDDRLVGTLPYMAPEQLEGHKATAASDIYALGLVIYEMVTGRQPFSGSAPLAAAYKRLKEPPPPPRPLALDLDGGIESVILRCLETKPGARYANATELVEVLGGQVRKGSGRRAGSKLAVAGWSLVALMALFAILLRNPTVRTMVERILHLGGSQAGDLTTSSPEARRRYLLAQDSYAKEEWNSALDMAKSALKFDPNFAMLHLLLAKVYQQLGDSDSADEHVRRAVQYAGHVTERERYLIEAMDYRSRDLDERAADRYRLVLSLYPNDLEALRGLAATDYWVDRSNEALGAQRRAAELTHSPLDYKVLMDLLDRTNRFAEALTVAAEARSSNADSPDLHFAAGLAYWGEDDLGAARQQFEILRRGGSTHGQNLAELYTARLLIYQGRMREADAELRTGLVLNEQQESGDWAPLYRFLLAHDLVLSGQLAAAKEEAAKLDLLVTGSDSPDPVDLQTAGSLALELGDVTKAKELLAIFDKQRARDSAAFAQLHFFNLRGNLELNEGRIQAAIEDQKRASVFYPSFEPYLSLARAYTAERDWKNAIGAYERYLQFRGEILRDDCAADLVLAQLYLARLYIESGQPSQAASHYDEFLHSWADADQDLPALREAQAERRQLHVN